MKPRKPIRSISTKRAKELAIYRKLKAKLFKHPRTCQRCQECNATDIHHSAGKIHGLLNYEPLFFYLCRSCHDWVTNHTEEARNDGWIVAKGRWNDTSLIK